MQFTQKCEGTTADALKRETILKRVVMNIIEEVRIEKAKPKLSDLLKLFNSDDGKRLPKEVILSKLEMLYSNKARDKDEDDKKFQELSSKFTRLQKSLQY